MTAPLAPWEPTTREEAEADRRYFDDLYDHDPADPDED